MSFKSFKIRKPINPWLMWALAAGFTLFQFFLQSVSALMVPELRESFHASAEGVAAISSSFYYIYVLVQVPAGMSIDVFGTRRVLTVTAVLLALGCVIFALAPTLEVAIFGRVVMGLGSGFSFVGMLTIIKDWFPARKFPLLVAVGETIGMLGTGIASMYFSSIILIFGWRNAILVTGVIAFIFSFALYIYIHDAPNPHRESFTNAVRALKDGFINVIKNRYLWMVGIYGGLMFSVATVYAGLWAIPYILQTHHIRLLAATAIATMVYVGLAVGAPLMGWLSQRFAIKALMIIGSILTAIIMACQIYYPAMSLPALYLSTFLLGISTSVYILNFTYAKMILPVTGQSTGLGLVNGLVMSTAALLQPMVAYIMNWSHRGTSVENIHYSTVDFQHGLLILPICFVLSMFVAICLKANKEQN